MTYLPPMGVGWMLPLYDPFSRFAGARRVHDRLLDQADLEAGQRVLEIGCGTGNLLARQASRGPAVEAIGIDPDAAALRRARRKARGVRYEQGYASRLDLPDGSVDRVLSSLMLHHLGVEERDRALREVRRVLRPGGRLHLVDIAGAHGPHRLRVGSIGPEVVVAALTAAGLTDITASEPAKVRFGHVIFYRACRT